MSLSGSSSCKSGAPISRIIQGVARAPSGYADPRNTCANFMARAEVVSASVTSDSIKGLAQSIAKPAYLRLLTAEPALRRAVPALIIAFLLTICIGAIVQVLDHRRQAISELVNQIDASADF